MWEHREAAIGSAVSERGCWTGAASPGLRLRWWAVRVSSVMERREDLCFIAHPGEGQRLIPHIKGVTVRVPAAKDLENLLDLLLQPLPNPSIVRRHPQIALLAASVRILTSISAASPPALATSRLKRITARFERGANHLRALYPYGCHIHGRIAPGGTDRSTRSGSDCRDRDGAPSGSGSGAKNTAETDTARAGGVVPFLA